MGDGSLLNFFVKDENKTSNGDLSFDETVDKRVRYFVIESVQISDIEAIVVQNRGHLGGISRIKL